MPRQWWIGVLKASTTCFSITPATALNGSLREFEWWADLAKASAGNTLFSWELDHKVFSHISSEDDQFWLKVHNATPVQYAQGNHHKNIKIIGQSHSKVLQHIMVLPNWIRLAACPALHKEGNRKVAQGSGVQDFSFHQAQWEIITAS